MRKHLTTLVLAVFVGVLGFAVSGVAVAAGNEKPPSPPGQGECEHGNSLKPCKEDPQPDHGKDCEQHGNQGGVNEDHCAGTETTTPTDTTPTETTPTETTPNETTPQDTVPADTSTPPSTDASEATSTQVTEAAPSESAQSTPTSVESPQAAPAATKKAAVKNEAAVLDATAPKPNTQAQQAPVTL